MRGFVIQTTETYDKSVLAYARVFEESLISKHWMEYKSVSCAFPPNLNLFQLMLKAGMPGENGVSVRSPVTMDPD